IKDYRNEKIDIRYRRECEVVIDELKGKFNGMSIEINKKKELQQLEQAANLSAYSTESLRWDHVPVFVPEFEHPEDLVSAEGEAPTSLLPPGFLSPRIQPLSPKALVAEMNAITSSLHRSLHPSRTPPLLPISTLSTSRRAGIPKANTPPQNRLFATPRPGCKVGESSAAAARCQGPAMAHGVDCRYMETRLQDTERRMMAFTSFWGGKHAMFYNV
nr:hypothetical protein [Tanacetum cinerariifolium]